MDRAVDRAARRRRLQDRSAAADLHRPDPDRLHAAGEALSAPANGPALPAWIDGRLVEAGASAHAEAGAPGCYTTARVRGGRATFLERHVARLCRDAAALGLPVPETEAVEEAFRVLGQAAFGEGEGIVRVEASRAGPGRGVLSATARPIGDGGTEWTACVAAFPHPGPAAALGAKLSQRPAWSRARALAQERAVDEVLLFDASGRLVEGARSNVVVIDGQGRARYPAPRLGAVAGLALGVLLDRIEGLEPATLDRAALEAAREVIALNAVRGVRPVVAIDGAPVGDGRPGPRARAWAARLEDAVQAESRSAR